MHVCKWVYQRTPTVVSTVSNRFTDSRPSPSVQDVLFLEKIKKLMIRNTNCEDDDELDQHNTEESEIIMEID